MLEWNYRQIALHNVGVCPTQETQEDTESQRGAKTKTGFISLPPAEEKAGLSAWTPTLLLSLEFILLFADFPLSLPVLFKS